VRLAPRVAAVVVTATGLVVLTGWTLRWTLLTTVAPGLPAMMPNTATAFALSGVALWLLSPPGAGGWRRRVGSGLGLLVALFGVAVLGEYVTGWRIGLDQWLFGRDVAEAGTRFPGRPSPHTAMAFLLAALALMSLDADRRRGHRPWLVLTPLSAVVALVALVGYVFQVRYLYGVVSGTGVALHTAVAFLLLNAGLLASRPDRQPTRMVLAPGPAGLLARRLLPALVLAPLGVGGLIVLAVRERLVEPALGTTLSTVAMLAALIVVIATTGRGLERLDQDRRAVQEELLAAERRYRQVTDAATDAIVSADADGRLRSWNTGAEGMFGWRAEEIVGQPLTVLMPQRLRALHMAGMEQVRRSGHSKLAGHVVELVALHRDGTEFPIGLSIGMWESHQRLWFSGIIRDITERKRAEQALEDARDAADQANQAKSEFLSRMSHELRTPLNAILGFAQLLEMDELTTEQRESLRYILSGGRHLLDLINEVLDIAAIEAGRLALSVEPVAVADVVGEAVDLIRPLADQRGIVISSGMETAPEHVMADRQRLKQILLNLLSNAVKYNREGGSVRLACEADAGRLAIAVTDTGPGIPAESVQRLFVPFERLAPEHGNVEGTGLGLALSRRLAEAMGGTLQVRTVVDEGSTFRVELPVATAPDDARRSEAASGAGLPEPLDEQLTVLYIEDNVSNMELIQRIMSRRGVRLIQAMRPLLGLELATQHGPDLVLLDLHLPDLPGEEVLRRLRADPRTAGVPVAVLSADARPAQVRHLKELGAAEFLSKPLDVEQLYRILDQITAQHRPSALPSPHR
jgi:PAS domain S-box-containing protein